MLHSVHDSGNSGDFDAMVYLVFRPNSLRGQTNKTDWVSRFGVHRVFSSSELDQCIKRADMSERVRTGERVLVGLKRREGLGVSLSSRFRRSNVFYHAFPVATIPFSLEVSRPAMTSLPIAASATDQVSVERRRRMAVFIDGQNFLFAADKLGVTTPVKVAALIKRILSFYEVKLARFYICWEADIIGFSIAPALRQVIEKIDGLEVVARQMKVIPNGRGAFGSKKKVDIDTWLATDLARVYSEWPGLEGVVLVAGDSDYVPGLQLWQREDQGGGKYVEVVSSKGTLSRELRDLPGVKVRLLEEMVL